MKNWELVFTDYDKDLIAGYYSRSKKLYVSKTFGTWRLFKSKDWEKTNIQKSSALSQKILDALAVSSFKGNWAFGEETVSKLIK